MRSILIATGLLAALAVAGCEQSQKTETTAATAPVAKKSLGRQRQMYQGQEPVAKVVSATVLPGATPTSLALTAEAVTSSAGYTRPTFLPRIYPAAPADGVYEVDVVAQKPDAAGAAVETPISVKGAWPNYPEGRLKGVKFISATNDVTVMLGQ
ncbi:MAG TPA: hypothetical protein VIO94_07580 [Phenylobacterium sp.]